MYAPRSIAAAESLMKAATSGERYFVTLLLSPCRVAIVVSSVGGKMKTSGLTIDFINHDSENLIKERASAFPQLSPTIGCCILFSQVEK